MKEDDIICLALNANLLNYVDLETPRRHFIRADAGVEEVTRFASLVAAAERERIMGLFSRIDWHDPRELGEFYREVSGRASPYSAKGDTVGQ